jgi:hypothetical protein
MYRSFKTICSKASSPVSSLSRQVVYVRPSQFVVYDRSTVCDASLDQYLAFHFPASPTEVAKPAAGLHRFDVTASSTFAGSMTTILPANAAITHTDAIISTGDPKIDPFILGKVWRTEIRPTDAAAATRKWMTVFDLAPSSSQVASATGVTINSGPAVGVILQSSTGNAVVISGTAAAGTAITGTLSYVVPANQTRHVITDLAPSTAYAISVAVSGGNQTVSIAQGAGSTTSANGVLTFQTSAGGQVTP